MPKLVTIIAVTLMLMLLGCTQEEEEAAGSPPHISKVDLERWLAEIKEFDDAISRHQRDFTLYLKRAEIKIYIEDYQGALNDYEKAILFIRLEARRHVDKAADLEPMLREAIRDREFAESKLQEQYPRSR